MKPFVSPQLPSPGEGWTGDSAVPGGREPHRLVKRGKIHGFMSLLQLQSMEGGGCLSVMSLSSVPKAGMWLRAESITAGSAPGLPAFSTALAVVCVLCTAWGSMKGNQDVMWTLLTLNSVIWGLCSFSYFNPSCL